ncbi:MAG: Crp/Fnr family transcriptional regulator [Rhizobiales bacterium]|nr:Crp/Fnr family transcriptional regulator [Hyphomicrobiales bacterium]
MAKKLDEEVELLRRIPIFAKIEPSRLKLLAFTSERVTYEPGQELCRQGDIGDAAYLVISGEAEILVDTPAGPLKIAEVSKNALVGEIAIINDVPRTATVKAGTRVEALRITKDHFLRLVAEFPQIAIEIMRVLATRLSRTNEELTDARRQLAEPAGG